MTVYFALLQLCSTFAEYEKEPVFTSHIAIGIHGYRSGRNGADPIVFNK